jgi:hypothetical protein
MSHGENERCRAHARTAYYLPESCEEATIAKQQKLIEALTVGLQKVSDQLELIKLAPQTVLNNQ